MGGDAADRRQRLKANYGELLIPFSLKNRGERAPGRFSALARVSSVCSSLQPLLALSNVEGKQGSK